MGLQNKTGEKMDNYNNFLESKKIRFEACGFEVDKNSLNSNLFDFQRDIVHWSLKKGKCARCWLLNICDELDVAELIEETRPDLHYMDTWDMYNEGDDDGSLRKELVDKASKLTDGDIYAITSEYCDDYFAGRACDT